MDTYPPVIALIITYRRLKTAIPTIQSVKQMVKYPNIGFHIADDGSGKEYIDRLLEEIGPTYSVEVTDAKGEGVGRSMNLGIQSLLKRSDMWLHLEDDWVLTRPLDLTPCVELLNDHDNIGMVRLGRLSAGIKAESMGAAGKMWWRMVRNSDTYVLAGHAALRHRRFAESYGRYSLGLTPGRTEVEYCSRFNLAESGPDIVWPAWLSIDDLFQHIGDHQSYKWWLENNDISPAEVAEMFERQQAEAS